RVSSRIVQSFFFQAEDGIRVRNVTGVQTCALPISPEEGLPGSLSESLFSLLPDITDPVDGPDPLRMFRVLLKFCPEPSDIHGKRSEERRVGKERNARRWTWR